MAQKRIAIIACSKTQSEDAKIVKEFYQGNLFRYGLDYAREVLAIPESDIYVLSTKHGLLSLYDKAPERYNTPVQRINRSRIGEVAKKLEEIKGDAEELIIYAFIGKKTIQYFKPFLSSHCRLESVYARARKLGQSSGMGYIISYLKHEVEAKRRENAN